MTGRRVMIRTQDGMVEVDGVAYVTTTQAVDRLNAAGAGVSAARLRDWKRRTLVDVVRDPDGNPVRVSGVTKCRGKENVWRYRDLAAVEALVGTSGQGRKRVAATVGGG